MTVINVNFKTRTLVRSAKGSITQDGIYCLFDNQHRTMLSAHLRTAYNMTGEEYRKVCGLPADYPLVAADYMEEKARLAASEPRPHRLVRVVDDRFSRTDFPPLVRSAVGSVEDEVVYCLLDGIATGFPQAYVLRNFGMTWAQYLRHCDLPNDYPNVAPYYYSERA